ncbi:MAG: glucose 1-dehydrogenase [Desulfomonilia bacterium]|jgi:NAD(P)-dependent dehydrogenase (short-subunit alcohol dehydrogenase family)|nr:glucose 1-dehydrogenase [Desulfomonilia bacterium]
MPDGSIFSVKGKVALVTGGGRGIGKAIARGFANAGAKIVISSRKEQNLEMTASEIKASGGEVLAVSAHLGRLEEIRRVANTVVDKFGRIDILVNCAATSPATASIIDTDERLWDSVMNLNLKGVYFMCQAVAKYMRKQGCGKIINFTSIASFNPEPRASSYSISKAGVRMVTRSFAMELARDNIQVNTICPGPVDTDMLRSNWTHLSPGEAKKKEEALIERLPTRRIADADEFIGAALYLASDASSNTTGAEIIVDGGVLYASSDRSVLLV